jgi:hypothetical protein
LADAATGLARHPRAAGDPVAARAMSRSRRPRAAYLAAGLAVACGVIHLAVAPVHFDHAALYGALFVAAGVGQLGLGVGILARPSQLLFSAGIAMNAAIIGAYVVSRTAGLPFAEEIKITTTDSIYAPAEAEPVGPLDLETTISELVLVVALVTLLTGRVRHWAINLLLGAGVLLWVLRMTGVLDAPLPGL